MKPQSNTVERPGGGWTGGILRRQAAALLCSCPVARQGPDSKRKAFQTDQFGGQPRGGRQGILLLSRLDADPLLHEVALQISARSGANPKRYPVRASVEHEAPAPSACSSRTSHGKHNPNP